MRKLISNLYPLIIFLAVALFVILICEVRELNNMILINAAEKKLMKIKIIDLTIKLKSAEDKNRLEEHKEIKDIKKLVIKLGKMREDYFIFYEKNRYILKKNKVEENICQDKNY